MNDTVFYLAEYNHRGKLRRLGYTDDISRLDALTAELFAVISNEIEDLEEEARKRQQRRGR
jgi:hypothetical protein